VSWRQDFDVAGVGVKSVDAGNCAVQQPMCGLDSVPAQRPTLGGQAATFGQGLVVATRSHVLLDEPARGGWVGGPAQPGPGSQVQQPGADERHREVEQPPLGRSDVDGAGVQFAVT